MLQEEEITNYIKKTWPLDSPAPRFRNNPEGMKAFQEVVDTLSKDEDYTLPKAGFFFFFQRLDWGAMHSPK